MSQPAPSPKRLKPFVHLPEIDARCFVVNPEFSSIVERLNLAEWSPVVWMGRLFCMDNDYGEHWFDNWDGREELSSKARESGYDENELMVVRENTFVDNHDGPCHKAETRLAFWIDVLKSIDVSLSTLFLLAREEDERLAEFEEEHPGMMRGARKGFDVEKAIAEIGRTPLRGEGEAIVP